MQGIIYNGFGQCVVSTLDISTGVNHESSIIYASDSVDQYWKLIQAPSGSYTGCSRSWNYTYLPGAGLSSVLSDEMPWVMSQGNIKLNCTDYGAPYIFERQFKIELPTGVSSTIGTIEFVSHVDDYVSNATLTGPGLAYTMASSACPISGFLSEASGPLTFVNGIYTLRFAVRNLYVSIFNVINTSMMNFELKGNVTTAIDALVDNQHFGKYLDCAPPYPPVPEFTILGNKCITPPSVNTTYTITPFNNGVGQNVYTIAGTGSPSIVQTGPGAGTFTIGVGNYTITSTDSKGCSFSTLLNIFSSPSLTVTPTTICIPPGTSVPILLLPSPGIWSDYTFQFNSDPPIGLSNPWYNLSQGFHTITAIANISGCTATVNSTIGNLFTLWSSATPPCISPGGTSILNSGPIPVFVGPKLYSYNSGPFLLPPTYTVTSTGIYTVVCTDQYGCTASNTVPVFASPPAFFTVNANPGCIHVNPFSSGSTMIMVTLTSPGIFQYQIKPLGGTWSTIQPSNIFTVNQVGEYEVRIVDENNCSSPSKKVYVGDCGHCYSEIPPANAQWYINATSSTMFSSGATPTTPIVIDGTLTVDDNLNIWNNPNIYFTYESKIVMNNNVIPTQLSINNSTLKPCYYWWHGVFANNDKQKIKIENNSTAKYMAFTTSGPTPSFISGFSLSNGAVIEATNSNFENNFYSIIVERAPGIYPGKIESNTFIMNDPLLANNWGYTGIMFHDVESAIIGSPNLIDVNKGNIFKNLNSGIYIHCGNDNMSGSPSSSSIKIYNNRFENIKSSSLPIGTIYRDWQVLSGTSNALTFASGQLSIHGSAIYSYSGKGYIGNIPFWPNLTVDVKDLTTNYDDSYTFFPGIYDCDRGIVTGNTNLIADQLYIDNTLLANMNYTVRPKNYQITNNFINQVHIGIQTIGKIGNSNINYNEILTRNNPIPYLRPDGLLIWYKSPIGIEVSHTSQNLLAGPFNHYIQNNTIGMPYITGIGIAVAGADAHQYVGKNEINFGTVSIAASNGHDIRALYGMHIQQCKGTWIEQNFISGMSNLTVWNARNSMGIYMDNSPKCVLSCNRAKWTRYGFYAWGNNATASNNVTYNKFSGNRYPWYFLDAGATLPATFGTQGGGGIDNGNIFLGTVNRLNSSGFKVFRNSTVILPDVVITDPMLLTLPESGSTTSLAEYQVQNPIGLINSDPCPDPLFITGGGGNGEGDEDMDEIEAIVNDEVNYIGHEEVGEWMDENEVYRALDEDNTLRYSSLELLDFYNTRYSTLIGKIYEANRAIALLADESTNVSNFESKYNAAVANNDLITGGEVWEMNEHDLNVIHLKLISESHVDTIGSDTIEVDSVRSIVMPITQIITESEKDFVRDLAHSCPFIAGTCVYRARGLWKRFDPSSFYDDRVLCIAGTNKNQDLSDVDIDSLYESQIQQYIATQPTVNTHSLKNGQVLIYPNPTNSNIIIEYTCTRGGKFELMNGTGQIILSTELGEGKRKVHMQANGLSKGLYFYRCSFDGCEEVYGKLVIE